MRPLDGSIPNVTSVLKRSNKDAQRDTESVHTQKGCIVHTVHIEDTVKRDILTKV